MDLPVECNCQDPLRSYCQIVRAKNALIAKIREKSRGYTFMEFVLPMYLRNGKNRTYSELLDEKFRHVAQKPRPRKHFCVRCDRNFDSPGKLFIHNRRVHGQRPLRKAIPFFVIEAVGKPFIKNYFVQNAYETHKIRREVEKVTDDRWEWKQERLCEIDDTEDDFRDRYKHWDVVGRKTDSWILRRPISSVEHVVRVINGKTRKFRCLKCPFTSPSLADFQPHSDRHALSSSRHCSQCSFSTEDEAELLKHLALHLRCNQIILSSSQKQTVFGPKKAIVGHRIGRFFQHIYLCNQCPYACSFFSHLLLHSRNHRAKEFGEKCTDCSFSSEMPGKLKSHSILHQAVKKVSTRRNSSKDYGSQKSRVSSSDASSLSAISTPSPPNQSPSVARRWFRCSRCPLESHDYQRIYRHKKIHSGSSRVLPIDEPRPEPKKEAELLPEPSTVEVDTVEPATVEPASVENVTVEAATVEEATVETATVEPATVEVEEDPRGLQLSVSDAILIEQYRPQLEMAASVDPKMSIRKFFNLINANAPLAPQQVDPAPAAPAPAPSFQVLLETVGAATVPPASAQSASASGASAPFQVLLEAVGAATVPPGPAPSASASCAAAPVQLLLEVIGAATVPPAPATSSPAPSAPAPCAPATFNFLLEAIGAATVPPVPASSAPAPCAPATINFLREVVGAATVPPAPASASVALTPIQSLLQETRATPASCAPLRATPASCAPLRHPLSRPNSLLRAMLASPVKEKASRPRARRAPASAPPPTPAPAPVSTKPAQQAVQEALQTPILTPELHSEASTSSTDSGPGQCATISSQSTLERLYQSKLDEAKKRGSVRFSEPLVESSPAKKPEEEPKKTGRRARKPVNDAEKVEIPAKEKMKTRSASGVSKRSYPKSTETPELPAKRPKITNVTPAPARATSTPKTAVKAPKIQEIPVKKFRCPEPNCPHEYEKKADYKKHLGMHNAQMPLTCSACSYSCFTLDALQAHTNQHRVADMRKENGVIPVETKPTTSSTRIVTKQNTKAKTSLPPPPAPTGIACPTAGCKFVAATGDQFLEHRKTHVVTKSVQKFMQHYKMTAPEIATKSVDKSSESTPSPALSLHADSDSPPVLSRETDFGPEIAPEVGVSGKSSAFHAVGTTPPSSIFPSPVAPQTVFPPMNPFAANFPAMMPNLNDPSALTVAVPHANYMQMSNMQMEYIRWMLTMQQNFANMTANQNFNNGNALSLMPMPMPMFPFGFPMLPPSQNNQQN